MNQSVTPWTELLAKRFRDVDKQYGPNTQVVASAFAALSEVPWLERVGEPWLESVDQPLADRDVVIVRSWDEALRIFDDERYNANGVLQAPCSCIEDVLDRMTNGDAWWQLARSDAAEYVALSGIPDSLSQEHQNLLFEHLYEFVSMVLVEIIASPEAGCSYFREQLAWFHSGHFPCGWDGTWPSGRMRVF
jgi:hypothetical protein